MTATPSPIPPFLRVVADALQRHGCRVGIRPGHALLWAAPGASTVNYLAVTAYALHCPALRVHVNTFQASTSKAALLRLELLGDACQASTPRLEFTCLPEELQAVAPWLAETILGISAAPCPVSIAGVAWPDYMWTRAAHEVYQAGRQRKGAA